MRTCLPLLASALLFILMTSCARSALQDKSAAKAEREKPPDPVQGKPKEKDPEPKERFCWDSVELYDDSDFKTKLPETDSFVKKFAEKRPKYEKMVKEECAKVFKEKTSEMVECPKYLLDKSPLRAAGEKGKLYHMRLKLAYDNDIVSITLYAKIEVYDGDKLVCEFKDERTIGIFRAMDRVRRKEALVRFGGKLLREMIDKTREATEKK